jgi:hypothetical protein
MAVLLYVLDEIAVRYISDQCKKHIRMYLDGKIGEDDFVWQLTCPPFRPTMKRDYPEVVDFVKNQG